VIRITIMCPEAHRDDANALAMALGQGPADGSTFRAAGWQDAAGAQYVAASLDVSPAWLAAAQDTLDRPSWDAAEPYAINMTGAARAQALLVLHDATGADPEAPPSPVPTATGDMILVLAGDSLPLVEAAGLSRIEEDGNG
jgi:hypothetical protein